MVKYPHTYKWKYIIIRPSNDMNIRPVLEKSTIQPNSLHEMSKKSLETSQLTMPTLRKGFNMYCKLLGLRQSTCLALTLMLNSRDLLLAMMLFMAIKDEERVQDTMDPEDITTMVVNKAAEMREAWDRIQKNTLL